ncbi:MAG: NAD-dependent epimerase/dehydratase family protein [Bacteroidota bacterium]
MQTILGAGGIIATELTKNLSQYTNQIRLVSRNPEQVHAEDELFSADLTQYEQVNQAVAGSEVVYLTVGFSYNYKVWKKMWQPTMENIIRACKKHQAKLVFFDNVYMYDAKHVGAMTEDTPIRPTSKKGKVRARIAQMLTDEIEKGDLTALIARSADFYGPEIKQNSILNEMVLKNLKSGKKANWLGTADAPHAFTYTPDAGKALALLGNTADAYQQVWHLPTAAQPPTGKEWIECAAAIMQTKADYQVASKMMTRLIGLFVPVMRETVEMIYQYEQPYVFNSSKFENRFGVLPTSYEEGLKQVIAADFQA